MADSQLGLASRVSSAVKTSKPTATRHRYGSGAAEQFSPMHRTAPARAPAAQTFSAAQQDALRQNALLKKKVVEAEARAAAAESFREQVAAAMEVREARAAAEAREAAADSLKEQVAAAEARAAAAEALAAVNEGASKGTPSWLERLASGDFGPLGDVEVVLAVSEAAVRARSSTESLNDAAEKRAWLKSLDVPMWGKAAMSLSEAASEAAGMASLTAMCDAGDGVSCRILSEQEKSLAKWPDKLNVPNWGEAAGVLSVAASDAAEVSAAALEALEGFGFLKHRHEHRSKEPSREPPEDVEEKGRGEEE